jgi:predicted Zn-ribbon and HTH transcriptional regulator
MSVHLKRLLKDNEEVDHINGDRTDERLENLQILDKDTHRNEDRTLVMKELKCEGCDVIFLRPKYDSNPNRFCSRKCYHESMKYNGG